MRSAAFLPSLIALLLSFSPCTCVAEGSSSPERPYRVAFFLPLTGSAASIGIAIRDAALLARDDFSSAQNQRIELEFQDDQFEPAKAVSAFRFLMSQNPVQAVVVVGSGMGHAVAPLAQEAGVILIALGASDKSLLNGRSLAFIHWVAPEREAKLMAVEVKRRGYKSIAMVNHEQQGVLAFKEALKAAMRDNGMAGIVAVDEDVAIGTNDFRTLISRINAKGPDAVYTALFAGGLAPFTKQLRSQGFKGEIFGAEIFEDEAEVKSADGALLDSWYANAAESQPWYVTAYRQRFGRYPGWASGNAYDTVKLLSEGAAQFKNDNQKIAGYLGSLKDYHGAVGRYSATGDRRFDLPAALKRISVNGFVNLADS